MSCTCPGSTMVMFSLFIRERKLELHQLSGEQRGRVEEAIKLKVEELLASQEVQKQIEVVPVFVAQYQKKLFLVFVVTLKN